MERFKAGVQYNDWTGTAAADGHDGGELQDHLKKNSLIGSDEVIAGVRIYTGENFFSATAYILPLAGFDNAKVTLANQDPVVVREVNIELTHEMFLKFFKRFEVVLTRNGLELNDREYVIQAS